MSQLHSLYLIGVAARRHLLAHQRIIPRDILDNGGRNIPVLDIRLSTEHDRTFSVVQQLLDALRVSHANDPPERVGLLGSVGVKGVVPACGRRLSTSVLLSEYRGKGWGRQTIDDDVHFLERLNEGILDASSDEHVFWTYADLQATVSNDGS